MAAEKMLCKSEDFRQVQADMVFPEERNDRHREKGLLEEGKGIEFTNIGVEVCHGSID